MADDLSSGGEIEDLLRRIKRLESATMLQNASVTKGRLRFIGGLLLIDSGGTLTVIGHFNGEGDFEWSGPWEFSGNGKISGDVDLTGALTVAGSQPIILHTQDGQATITAGQGHVRGTSDGINVAAPGGGSLFAAAGSVQAAGATYGTYQVAATANGIEMIGLPTVNAGDVDSWLAIKDGYIAKVDPSTGGPMGSGEFAWPFPLSLVTQEYDPSNPDYTNGHLGIDFGSGIANVQGTPIPAASNGTILANDWDSERGWHVIIDHGTRGSYALTTRYYHLYQQSPIAEGLPAMKGQSIGGIGNTGLSSGNHLHFETRRNGEPMNPRSFMSIYGE